MFSSIGFIGTGTMGAAVARAAVKGADAVRHQQYGKHQASKYDDQLPAANDH